MLHVLLPLLSLLVQTPSTAPVDYGAVYETGTSYTAFVEGAPARTAEWKRNTASAALPDEVKARLGALPGKRRLLVVAEASCSDSVNTIPYLARLVEAAPERLEMRVVGKDVGLAVMEAHRTPDGRAATPTVVVLEEDGRVVGAWSERPAALQEWYIATKGSLSQRELVQQKGQWYEKDAGRSTLSEVLALLLKPLH